MNGYLVSHYPSLGIANRRKIPVGTDGSRSTLTRRFAPPSPTGRGWREAPGEGRTTPVGPHRDFPSIGDPQGRIMAHQITIHREEMLMETRRVLLIALACLAAACLQMRFASFNA